MVNTPVTVAPHANSSLRVASFDRPLIVTVVASRSLSANRSMVGTSDRPSMVRLPTEAPGENRLEGIAALNLPFLLSTVTARASQQPPQSLHADSYMCAGMTDRKTVGACRWDRLPASQYMKGNSNSSSVDEISVPWNCR